MIVVSVREITNDDIKTIFATSDTFIVRSLLSALQERIEIAELAELFDGEEDDERAS